MDFLKLHNGCVVHHDQGIINAVCEGHKLIVHPRYNVMSPFFSHPYRYMAKYNNPFYSSKEIQEAINKPVLIHFTEGFLNRPWVKHCSHPMKNLFVQYHSLTLWKDTAMRPDNRSWAVRILSWVFLHLPIWCFRVTQFLFSVIKGENRR